ncbi:Leucine rich repeat domain containing protein [Balamuthia mandrillaris]
MATSFKLKTKELEYVEEVLAKHCDNQILYATWVKKINPKGKVQARFLVLAPYRIYSFKITAYGKKALQRSAYYFELQELESFEPTYLDMKFESFNLKLTSEHVPVIIQKVRLLHAALHPHLPKFALTLKLNPKSVLPIDEPTDNEDENKDEAFNSFWFVFCGWSVYYGVVNRLTEGEVMLPSSLSSIRGDLSEVLSSPRQKQEKSGGSFLHLRRSSSVTSSSSTRYLPRLRSYMLGKFENKERELLNPPLQTMKQFRALARTLYWNKWFNQLSFVDYLFFVADLDEEETEEENKEDGEERKKRKENKRREEEQGTSKEELHVQNGERIDWEELGSLITDILQNNSSLTGLTLSGVPLSSRFWKNLVACMQRKRRLRAFSSFSSAATVSMMATASSADSASLSPRGSSPQNSEQETSSSSEDPFSVIPCNVLPLRHLDLSNTRLGEGGSTVLQLVAAFIKLFASKLETIRLSNGGLQSSLNATGLVFDSLILAGDNLSLLDLSENDMDGCVVQEGEATLQRLIPLLVGSTLTNSRHLSLHLRNTGFHLGSISKAFKANKSCPLVYLNISHNSLHTNNNNNNNIREDEDDVQVLESYLSSTQRLRCLDVSATRNLDGGILVRLAKALSSNLCFGELIPDKRHFELIAANNDLLSRGERQKKKKEHEKEIKNKNKKERKERTDEEEKKEEQLKNIELMCLEVCSRNRVMHTLVLSDCHLGDRGMQRLFSSLSQWNSPLKVLDVSCNLRESKAQTASRSETEKALRIFLSNDSHLTTLIIRGGQSTILNESERRFCFGPKLGAALYALTKNNSLKELDITGNKMGEEGISALCTAIKRNETLTALHFDENDITLQGFQELKACFEQNHSLTQLQFPKLDIKQVFAEIDAATVQKPFRTIKRSQTKDIILMLSKEEEERWAKLEANGTKMETLQHAKKKMEEVLTAINFAVQRNIQEALQSSSSSISSFSSSSSTVPTKKMLSNGEGGKKKKKKKNKKEKSKKRTHRIPSWVSEEGDVSPNAGKKPSGSKRKGTDYSPFPSMSNNSVAPAGRDIVELEEQT